MRKALHDHPFRIDGLLFVLVLLHWSLTIPGLLSLARLSELPNVWTPLATAEQGTVRDLYVAMLGPSAIVAGFAGVVVVFGLTTDSLRFRKFRADAGDSLKRTWVASSLSGFVAGLAFVAACILSIAGAQVTAPFAFELGLLLLVHGGWRLLWILHALIGIKATDDVEAVAKDNEAPLSRMPWNRSA